MSLTVEPDRPTRVGSTVDRVIGSSDQVVTRWSDHVVVVDRRGRAIGTIPKTDAHHRTTALHLAFSCHVVRADGAVLLTRRALTKPTWPGAWTNGCCGHPQVGETLRDAVTRRIAEELGVTPTAVRMVIADFAYRAVMADGTVEHELCPVVVVSVVGELAPDPAEVADVQWLAWDELVQRAQLDPASLSPWSVEQVRQMAASGTSPVAELSTPPGPGRDAGLDTVIELDGRPALDDAVGGGPRLGDPRRRILLSATDHGGQPVQVEALIAGFLEDKAASLGQVDPTLAPVAREIRSLFDAGGKRLRPAFAYWGHRATGAAHDDRVLRAAAAIELLHTFALIHDDVMDRSAVRRGRPSAYSAFADEHRSSAATGDSDWFGVSAAVLAGDLAFVWADELFESCGLGVAAVSRAREVFSTLRTEVIAGQYLDLTLAADAAAREGGAQRVALLKSARYTVTRPLLFGAALAADGPDPGLESCLVAYGDAVGLAFQMRDDILGVFGDPTVTGKSRLDDLRGGKQTLLILRAMRLADDRGRDVLLRCIGDPTLNDERAAACREVISCSGALASVERLIANRHEVALAAIEQLDDPAWTALVGLASLAIERQD